MRTTVVFVIIIANLHLDGQCSIVKREVDTIKYPGPVKGMDSSKVDDASVPPQCRGLTYCTVKPDDYPTDKFNKMFKNYTQPLLTQPTLAMDPTLVNRQGDPDEEDDCASTVTYTALYKVRESDDSPWRTVIQAPVAGYIQKVRLEKCQSSGSESQCFKPFDAPKGVRAQCEQRYMKWNVLVEGENGVNEQIKAELPICCVCHYIRIKN